MNANDYASIKSALEQGYDAGKTDSGNLVTFGYAEFGAVTRTIFQNNGWACIQYFHEDGTVEEMFERYEG